MGIPWKRDRRPVPMVDRQFLVARPYLSHPRIEGDNRSTVEEEAAARP